jgi:acetyltransferase
LHCLKGHEDRDRLAAGATGGGRSLKADIGLAHDVFRRGRHPLDPFFKPRAVAVIGATEKPGSVGRTVLANLVATPFGGPVHPVNPRRESILGLRSYKSIGDVPGPIDLAVVVTPAATVPEIIRQCAGAGVPAALIISAGFRETGAAGAELEAQVFTEARRGGMRLVGPNCLGVMSPASGLNATFAAGMARPGRVAFLSQSGALLTAILDWSVREEVGFSAFVSTGSMLDVGWGDLIDYFGNDAATRAIVIYMESIGDARAFLSAAREVALTKPIVVIKAGRSEAASRAATSHTGALTGSDDVLDAAFRRAGVLRVSAIEEVFDLAEMLGKQPRPVGRRLAIVTNAGGPGVLATDALVAGGGELAELSPDARGRLDAVLPPAWSRGNPIDVLGDATPDRYEQALAIAAADQGSDGLLVILTPQDMTDPTRTAEALCRYAHVDGKPLLASWMGGARVAAGVDILNRAGVPTFEFPDDAARAFCDIGRFADNLRALYETPVPKTGDDGHPEQAQAIVDRARGEGRVLLDEAEAKAVLASYGIPVVPTRVAGVPEEAVAAARALGFPVAVKLWSRVVTHKTDVGGVKLNVADESGVARAFDEIRAGAIAAAGEGDGVFLGVTVQPMIDRSAGHELILGSTVDRQLGPVLLFGAGGELVEVLRDRAIGLPPLTTTLARRLIDETRIARALRGVRGRPPVDLDGLASLIARFGDLVADQRRIREIDINPLLATPTGAVALDARVVLHNPAMGDAELPRPAIRPYPAEYVWTETARDGAPFTIRPIRPDDEPLLVAFHGRLSEESVRLRYLHPFKLDARTAHERLIRACFVDYDREMALVAEVRTASGAREIAAVGRLSRDRDGSDGAEFALLVADPWQRRGIGLALLQRLVEIACRERIGRVYADILAANVGMQQLCARVGFTLDPMPEAGVVSALLEIGPPVATGMSERRTS